MSHAVVIVSGGAAVSPYTTPTLACGSGLAAGNTDTYLRERLLAAGFTVYTAPASDVPGPVADADPESFGAFGSQPVVLPSDVTLVSTGPIDDAGAALARFALYLHEHEGVTEISWVGHSNGGLFSTAATRFLTERGVPVQVRSLVTLGTPWMGTVPIRAVIGEISPAEVRRNSQGVALMDAVDLHADSAGDRGLAQQNTYGYLVGADGWLARQTGALTGIPVLLVGGTWLADNGGDAEVWPFDGLVSEHSALAKNVPTSVIPNRRELSVPLLHSIFMADFYGQPWEVGMTWNPTVADAVIAHLRR